MVSVSISHSCLGAGYVADNVAYVEADDNTPDTAVARIYTVYAGGAITQCLNMFFVVPSGSYYKVTDDDSGGGTSTIVYWAEWTIL